MHPRKPSGVFSVIAMLAPLVAFPAQPPLSGHVIDQNGKAVAQAIVFVLDPASSPTVAHVPMATMDQLNQTFVPAVLPVVAGTWVRFPNRDQIRHHVYSFSRAKRFELPLYKGEEAPPVLFDKAGVVTIGCNIHDWMVATILVLPSTHYAVTDVNGEFTLRRLDAGSYTLAAWHAQSREKAEETAQRVDAAASGAAVTFKLLLAPARQRPATRGSRWNQ